MANERLEVCLDAISSMDDADRVAVLNHLLEGMPADDLLAIASSLFTSVYHYKGASKENAMPEDFLKLAITATIKLQQSNACNILYLLARVLASVQGSGDHLPMTSLPFAVIELTLQSLFVSGSQDFHNTPPGRLIGNCLLRGCEMVDDPQEFLDHMSALFFPWGAQKYKHIEGADGNTGRSKVLLVVNSQFIETDTATDAQGLHVHKMQRSSTNKVIEIGSFQRKPKALRVQNPPILGLSSSNMVVNPTMVATLATPIQTKASNAAKTVKRSLENELTYVKPKISAPNVTNQTQVASAVTQTKVSSVPLSRATKELPVDDLQPVNQTNHTVENIPLKTAIKKRNLPMSVSAPTVHSPVTVLVGGDVYRDADSDTDLMDFTAEPENIDDPNLSTAENVSTDNEGFKFYSFQSEVPRKSKASLDVDWDKVEKKTAIGPLRLCKVCKRQKPKKRVQFDTKAELEQHMFEVHSEQSDGSFQCHLCQPGRFESKSDLEHHIGVHKRTCKVCQYVVPEHAKLRSHRQLHQPCKTPVPCQYCHMAFETNWEQRTHVFYSHEDKLPYGCEPCMSRFKLQLSFDEHVLVRHQNVHKSHECTLCGEKFDFSSSLKIHKVNVHVNPGSAKLKKPKGRATFSKTYHCKHCRATFSSQDAKEQHYNEYPDHMPYQCSDCNERFLTKQNIDYHMKWHHNATGQPMKKSPKPKMETHYVCAHCGKVEKTYAAMNLHKHRAHLGNLKYGTASCYICGKKFASEQVVKKHINYVHKQQRRECQSNCEMCPKKFNRYESFRDHMRKIHNKEPTKLVCEYCKRKFRWQYTLKTHYCKNKPAQEVEKAQTTAGDPVQVLGSASSLNPAMSQKNPEHNQDMWDLLQVNESAGENTVQNTAVEELMDSRLTFEVSEMKDDQLDLVQPEIEPNLDATQSDVEQIIETDQEKHQETILEQSIQEPERSTPAKVISQTNNPRNPAVSRGITPHKSPTRVIVVGPNQLAGETIEHFPKHVSLFNNSLQQQTDTPIELTSTDIRSVTVLNPGSEKEVTMTTGPRYVQVGNMLFPVKEYSEKAGK